MSVSDEYLLKGFQEAFVLGARADRDPEPAGDRFTIVMADEDPSLAQGVRDGRRHSVVGQLNTMIGRTSRPPNFAGTCLAVVP